MYLTYSSYLLNCHFSISLQLLNPFPFFIQESFDSRRRHQTEFGSASLSQATIKMEEYHDLLKSTEAWIENTSHLLADPSDYDSSKTLSHHASTLQVSVLSLFAGCHRMYIMINGLAWPSWCFPPHVFPIKDSLILKHAKWQKEVWESGRLSIGILETRI